VIGTVKTLSKLYGIDYLLKAAAIVVKHNPEIDLSIKIAGDGPNAEEYRELSKKLGIAERTFFWEESHKKVLQLNGLYGYWHYSFGFI
jgi:glycosyltransferase involved in cell wall biosynthesis